MKTGYLVVKTGYLVVKTGYLVAKTGYLVANTCWDVPVHPARISLFRAGPDKRRTRS